MRTVDPWAPADPLGEALHLLRMNGAFYCRSELTAPWGLTLPAMPGHIWFHVVVSGSLHLDGDTAEPVTVGPGGLALVPHGHGHRLTSHPGAPAPHILSLHREAVSQRYEILRHGDGGAPTALICGAVRFDHPAAANLLALLPETIHIEAPADGGWLAGTLALMAAEARTLLPGGEAVITRLGDILVIQAIRTWIESDPAARTGWLGALRDPRIGRAIALIHRDPARQWTVAVLARELAMSRSAFSARFTELVGEPVMRYLTRWRMHLALSALHDDDATAAELASRLGYRSEAAFARAFKRVMGIPPGAAKRGSPRPEAIAADAVGAAGRGPSGPASSTGSGGSPPSA